MSAGLAAVRSPRALPQLEAAGAAFTACLVWLWRCLVDATGLVSGAVALRPLSAGAAGAAAAGAAGAVWVEAV